jgi:hypothetical protein
MQCCVELKKKRGTCSRFGADFGSEKDPHSSSRLVLAAACCIHQGLIHQRNGRSSAVIPLLTHHIDDGALLLDPTPDHFQNYHHFRRGCISIEKLLFFSSEPRVQRVKTTKIDSISPHT